MVPPHPSLSINDLGGKVSRMFHFIPYVAKNDFHEQVFPGAGLSFSNSKNLFPELVHSLDDIPGSEKTSFIFLLPLGK